MQRGQGQKGRQGVIIDEKIEEHGSLMGALWETSREVGMTGMELENGSKVMIEAGMM